VIRAPPISVASSSASMSGQEATGAREGAPGHSVCGQGRAFVGSTRAVRVSASPTLTDVSDEKRGGRERTLDVLLAQVQQAHRDRMAHFDGLDQKGGIYFALAGALVGLSATLPPAAGVAEAMFAGFAVYYSGAAVNLRRVGISQPRYLVERYEHEPPEKIQEVLMDATLGEIEKLDFEISDKVWCLETAQVFLICAFFTAGIGVVSSAWI
jgi:hypothetical protein